MSSATTDPLGEIPPRSSLKFTEKWSRESLKAFRTRGDPPADAVVALLHREKGLTNIRDLLGTVRTRAAAGDATCNAFLDQVNVVPSWVDWKTIEHGSEVQAVYSAAMGPSLFAGSLVGGAMFKQAAIVTALAGNLGSKDGSSRRVTETALMIAQLAFPGALRVGGKAHETLARVRLLHAGIRHWLPSSGRYTRKDEIPVNQHDLAITMSLFGYVNIRSLRLMGVMLDRQEIDSYIHMWRYAGYVLGIENDLLPVDVFDQRDFFLASCIDEAHPKWIPLESRVVMDSMAIQANKHTYGMLPVSVAQTFLYQLTRFLSGNEYCEGMQLEDLGDRHWAVMLAYGHGRFTTFMAHVVPGGRWVLSRGNLARITHMVAEHEKQNDGLVGAKIGAPAPTGLSVANSPKTTNVARL